jgi:hypothetical protein
MTERLAYFLMGTLTWPVFVCAILLIGTWS